MEIGNKFAELSAPSFALAWAITMAIVYSIKLAFITQFREHALKLISDVTHLQIIDILEKRLAPTWQSYFSGVLQVFVYTFLITLLAALLYNAFIRAKNKINQ